MASVLPLRRRCGSSRRRGRQTFSAGLKACCANWRDKITGLGVPMFQKIAARALLAGTVLLIPSFAIKAQTQTTGNVFTGSKNIESIVAWVNNDIILKSEYDKRVEEIRADLAKDPKL